MIIRDTLWLNYKGRGAIMDYNNEAVQEKTDELGIPEELDKKKKVRRFPASKVLLFIFIALYFVVTLYRIPFLVAIGKYLIVEH